MKISKSGIDLIAKWEGFRSNAYLDVVGVWTIGYGHTKGVRPGDTITKTEAKKWLESEIERHVAKFDTYIKVPLTQGQFDALASFHYNLGANILKGTGLLDAINKQDWESASKQMLLYNKGGGRIIQGLVNRRKEESELFLKSSPTKETPKKESPQKAPATNSPSNTYKVKNGDTLGEIAKKYKTTVKKLTELNNIDNPNLIQVGQTIKLPKTEKFKTVKKGDTLGKIAKSSNLSLAELLKLNPSKKKNPDLINVGEKIRIE